MSRLVRVARLAALACVLAACGPPGAVRTVSLRVAGAGPRNASVTVDDQFVGTLEFVQARGVALPPGVHHVTIEAPGYLPFDKAIEAREGDPPIRLDVKLVAVPD
jgi:PEGA domain